MCSRILPRKGFQYAIEACAGLETDWEIHVIGDGPYLDDLKKVAGRKDVPVTFWGWLGKKDNRFKDLYQTSSIFIFPSEAENFPVVLLEAMAAGHAIIASTAGGCPEVVGTAALLVEPRDAGAIRENLLKLVGSEPLRLQLGRKALEQVQQFSWINVTGQYLDCYRKVKESR